MWKNVKPNLDQIKKNVKPKNQKKTMEAVFSRIFYKSKKDAKQLDAFEVKT